MYMFLSFTVIDIGSYVNKPEPEPEQNKPTSSNASSIRLNIDMCAAAAVATFDILSMCPNKLMFIWFAVEGDIN